MRETKSVRRKDIDILKGIGILLVVIGHSIPELPNFSNLIYLFHMPLFFYISGIFFRANKSIQELTNKKLKALILPYFAYLLIFNSKAIIGFSINCLKGISNEKLKFYGEHFLDQLYGGSRLTGDLSVFWFIPCLFFTQIIYAFVARQNVSIRVLTISVFYGLAIVNQFIFPEYSLPLALNISLFAIVFFHLGYLIKDKLLDHKVYNILMLLVILSASYRLFSGEYGISLNMKEVNYGYPVLSIFTALSFINLTFVIARKMQNSNFITNRIFVLLGNASMTIMFVHQFIKHHIFWDHQVQNPIVVTLGVTGISIAIFLIQDSSKYMQYLFLGKPFLGRAKA